MIDGSGKSEVMTGSRVGESESARFAYGRQEMKGTKESKAKFKMFSRIDVFS